MSIRNNSDTNFISAEEWFSGGRRVLFDPQQKRIVTAPSPNTVNVFQRTAYPMKASTPPSRWLTLLPGFPDGSYGYAKVDQLLEESTNSMVCDVPRLYVEYVGQGDSDKPVNYKYSTMERADLVEAQWRSNGVRKTVVVTFDFSSLVLMELLRRQMERPSSSTYIEHVLILNGGIFADGHSHPWNTTPLLQTRFGRVGSRMAQHSNWMLNTMLRPLHSKSYRSKQSQRSELCEIRKTIRRHKGTCVLPVAAGFVREHQKYADRWNLYHILTNLQSQNQTITFEIVGSNEDPYEHRQINLARQRLHAFYPQVRTDRIPGGHLSTAERTQDIVARIEALAIKTSITAGSSVAPSWSNVTTSHRSQPSWTAIY